MAQKTVFPLFLVFLLVFFTHPGLSEAAQAPNRNKKLEVIDASEIQLDGASTLSITFNLPLKKDQKFSDILSLVDTKSGNVEGAWELKDTQTELLLRYLQPERKLILTIGPQLMAENNRNLATEYTTTIETRPVAPSIGFASTGMLLPLRLSEGLPVVTFNVNSVDVDFFRIRDTAIHKVLADRNPATPINVWEIESDLKKQADLVFTGRFNLNPKPNRQETVYIPVTGIQPLQEPGVYFALMRQAGNYSYRMPATFFTLSDIGISLHRYAYGLSLFCQSLSTGKVLPDIQLTLFDESGNILAAAKTDEEGYGELPDDDNAKVILAQKGKETTLLLLSAPALDLSEFSVTGPASSPLQFFVFSPRDLFRPGEIVPLNGLLRDQDGKPVPAQPISVTVQQPDGKTASTFTWSAGKDHFYHYLLRLSPDSPTGRWRLLFDLGDGTSLHHEFLVEDFLPERMALEIKGSEEPLFRGDSIDFTVEGHYLYGAPASGNLLTSKLFVGFLREAVPALPGYLFGSVTETAPDTPVELEDAYLDDDGKADISLANAWESIQSPLRLVYQASLQESGGRSVTRRFLQPLWPSATLPGLRGVFTVTDKNAKGEPYIDANTLTTVEVVLADPDGNKHAATLRARAIQERRNYYWVYSDANGWTSRFDEKHITFFDEAVSIEEGGTGKISFPTEWGPYRVEVEDPQTGMISSMRFWAGYRWQDNTQAGAIRPDQVKMALDKPAYQTGDTVTITLTPPAAGSGYLMVESDDGPLWWQAIQVPAEGKAFTFPIPSDWARHDLYVSALVVRPGDKKALQTPKRAVGLLHLPLDRKDRKLDLVITAPEKIRPNTPLTVKVQAADASGKIPETARAIISAVDVGILNITEFETPDPFDHFFSRKAYGADQLDVYGSIIETKKGNRAALAFGGDAAGMTPGGKKPDTSVLIVALQSDALSFDEDGVAEATLDIPDFNGTLRLMTQAWTQDQYGAAEEKTVVAAPLAMEMSMPRFLAGGDKARLALDLSNLSGEPQDITFSLSTKGSVHLENTPAEMPVSLKKGERKILTFDVAATGGMTTGTLGAAASGLKLPEGESPSIEKNWTLGVRPAHPAKVQQYRAILKPGESWNAPQDLLASCFVEGREALVRVSDKPPLNVARNIQELSAYPYGCLEQTTSGLFPFLYVNEAILRDLGIKGETDKDRRDKIEIGISRLLNMQRHSGGFGMWSRDDSESFWLTVYVTDFLLRAREKGFDVPEAALEKATARIRYYLNNASAIQPDYSSDLNHLRFAVQAYAGYVLARSHQAPLGVLRSIESHKDDAKSGLSLVQLGIALRLMGDSEKGDALITKGAIFKEDDTRYVWYGDYGSKIRNNAMICALLLEHRMEEKKWDTLLFQLSDDVMDSRWLSTQERNALVLAGRFLLSQSESEWTADVAAENKTFSLTEKAPGLRLTDGDVKLPIRITNPSKETLYAQFSVSAYPDKAPDPVSDAITLEREFLTLEGEKLDLSTLKSGDMVLVHLAVRADRRISDALVVDFLPAGVELENQNLQHASVSLQDAASNLKKLLAKMEEARIVHQEYRSDRYVAAIDLQENGVTHLLYLARAVTPGRYGVPSATAHSMYRPQWQAIGASQGPLVISPR